MRLIKIRSRYMETGTAFPQASCQLISISLLGLAYESCRISHGKCDGCLLLPKSRVHSRCDLRCCGVGARACDVVGEVLNHRCLCGSAEGWGNDGLVRSLLIRSDVFGTGLRALAVAGLCVRT